MENGTKWNENLYMNIKIFKKKIAETLKPTPKNDFLAA